jgi:MinD-like ATPase involved in chromosome partitioning or flagellar assembly
MIYTFYSYKGGVGRTMALANIAELFYRAGRKVLIIDWDLEAPGLERFFPLDSDQILDQPGIIDLLLQYKNRMATVNVSGQPFTLESPHKYIVNIYPQYKEIGKLLLLTAGKRTKGNFASYVHAVQTFNWQEFYEVWEGELYFNWLRDQFMQIADVVLIDSRTGVSEMGGVCTYHLADAIVMLCAPNQQNLNGTQLMARNFTSPEVRRLRGGRDLFVLPVPTRLERAESDQLDDFRKQFLEMFNGFAPNIKGIDIRQLWSIRIPYIPKYAYSERVAVREKEQESANDIFEAYERLFDTLVQLLPTTVQQNDDKPAYVSQEGKHQVIQPDKLPVQNLQKLYWSPLWQTKRQLPPIPIDNWWKSVHLEIDPFGPEQAEFDPDLPKRAVYVDVLSQCLSSRRTAIIFGATGAGKTACARLLAYSCIYPGLDMSETSTYPVLHTLSLGIESEKLDDGLSKFFAYILANSFVPFFLRNIYQFLMLQDSAKLAIALCLLHGFGSIERVNTQLRLHGTKNSEERKQFLAEIGSLIQGISTFDFSAEEWLDIFSNARPYAFEQTYLIMDVAGKDGQDAVVLSKYVQAMIDYWMTSEVSNVYLKLLLPDSILPHLKVPRDVVACKIEWSDAKLQEMLDWRMRDKKGRRINFNELFDEDAKAANPAKLLIEAAKGSPRRLIRIGNRLLEEHVRQQPIPETLSYHSLERAIAQVDTES